MFWFLAPWQLPWSQFVFLFLGLVPRGHREFTEWRKAVDLLVKLFDLRPDLDKFFGIGRDIVSIPFTSFPSVTNGRSELRGRGRVEDWVLKILDFVWVFLHPKLDPLSLGTLGLNVVLPEVLILPMLARLARRSPSIPFFLTSFWVYKSELHLYSVVSLNFNFSINYNNHVLECFFEISLAMSFSHSHKITINILNSFGTEVPVSIFFFWLKEKKCRLSLPHINTHFFFFDKWDWPILDKNKFLLPESEKSLTSESESESSKEGAELVESEKKIGRKQTISYQKSTKLSKQDRQTMPAVNRASISVLNLTFNFNLLTTTMSHTVKQRYHCFPYNSFSIYEAEICL